MNDQSFNELIPFYLQEKIKQHFSPKEVILKAAEFLCTASNTKILDVGSGVGKFCLLAAQEYPEHHFYGIEIREDLHEAARQLQKKIKVNNVTFLNGNVREMSLQEYHHFYLFNPFYEHLEPENGIDQSMVFSEKKYLSYSAHVYKQLERMPPGTRVATFHVVEATLPSSYALLNSWYDNSLIGYEKLY